MNSKIVLVLLMAFVATTLALVCPSNYCEKVDCTNSIEKNDCEQNQNGIYEEHGSFCGCCPTCLTKLGEGDNCFTTLLRGVPPRSKCGPGLICDINTRKCVSQQY